MGKTTVCQWERGTRNPSYRMGVKAVSVLKKPFEDLFRLEGSGSP